MVRTLEPPRGHIPKLGNRSDEQRYNVAASRARDQMWLFHSMTPDQLNPDCVRFKLLNHFLNPPALDVTPFEDPVDRYVKRSPFDSLFEQRVFLDIRERGYVVQPQVKAYGRRIDIVVAGSNGKLAVECDGSAWHGPETFAKDLARQRDLERAGWIFFRIRDTGYYLDPAQALEPLWALLAERGIQPRGIGGNLTVSVTTALPPPEVTSTPSAARPGLPEEGSVGDGLVDSLVALHGAARPGLPEEGSVGRADPPRPGVGSVADAPLGEESAEPVSFPEATEEPERIAPAVTEPELPPEATTRRGPQRRPQNVPEHSADVVPWPDPVPSGQPPHSPSHLEPYVAWESRPVPPIKDLGRGALVGLLEEIIDVEGPAVAERVYQLANKAAGTKKLGNIIRQTLDDAVKSAERRGEIIRSDPLSSGSSLDATLRLPEQPAVRARTLGPRKSLSHIPPEELSRALPRTDSRSVSAEERYRAVLSQYGFKRLTSGIRELLERCERLPDPPPQE